MEKEIKNTDKTKLEKAVASYGVINNCSGSDGRSFQSLGGNTIRSSFNRSDYNYYRPGEGLPCTVDGSIEVCNRVYRDNPFVRSIIDMMGDFTVAGIRIEHRNSKIQNFLNDWIKYVNFYSFSERIANMLYRTSNCPIKLVYGKINSKIETKWKRATADEIIIKNDKPQFRRIPLKYEILNPLTIESIGSDISPFIGEPVYGLRLPHSGNYDVKRMNTILNQYNMDLKVDDLNIKTIDGSTVIPLNKENFRFLFYKKDDWCPKAWPMIHCVLDPLFMLEKMHLADRKALDGAISQIRLWTLGNFDFKIFPSPAALNKLKDVLSNVGNGDSMDLVWGPELTFKESDPKGYQFLKKEKYEQVMTEIYAGLGVPSSLTGGSSYEGYSSSSISMKAMVERLEYVRNIIKDFWEEQLKIVQEAFGWKYPAKVTFDYKVMNDENIERKLLLDMWDRNIISTEKFRQLCQHDPILEKLRIQKENKDIQNNKSPDKVGPFHNTDIENNLKKIIMQSGGVAPSELGIHLLEKKKGEKTLNESKNKGMSTSIKQPGIAGEGRPLGSNDSSQRTRTERPRTAKAALEDKNDFITLFTWAESAQETIHNMMSKFFLHHLSKNNLRNLTKDESIEFEKLKLFTFCNFKPFEEINAKSISEKMDGEYNQDILFYISYLNNNFVSKNNREPTITEVRQMQSTAFALNYEKA